MEDNDIAVIYQDHYLLIVNKAAGIVIHPTYKHADDTLWNALLAYMARQADDGWRPPVLPDEPEWAQAPSAVQAMLREKRTQRLWKEEGSLPRPCLLHRLDKDTSGIVALALTERSRRHLVRQFVERTVRKRYLAVVQQGAPAWTQPRTTFTITRRNADDKTAGSVSCALSSPGQEIILDGPLQRDPSDRRRCLVGPDGQQAVTAIKVLSCYQDFTLLDVRPITGRTHQIRAHLAALGYAIAGDQVYGPPARNGTPAAALPRQFLHAYSLTLRCYPNNNQGTFGAPLAEDLARWLERYCPGLWTTYQHLETLA